MAITAGYPCIKHEIPGPEVESGQMLNDVGVGRRCVLQRKFDGLDRIAVVPPSLVAVVVGIDSDE